MWTFLFFCDPFIGSEKANYVSDIPGNSLSDIKSWVPECLHEKSLKDHLISLENDGFGVVVKILRDIKSSWKLMLNEFEDFLETIVRASETEYLLHIVLVFVCLKPPLTSRPQNENYCEEEFIESAPFLHREFILNLDYIQRQLFYHRRYVTYLTSPVTHPETHIAPSIYHQDLIQEGDALGFIDLRLKALRNRTTAVLEMVSTRKQSNLPICASGHDSSFGFQLLMSDFDTAL